MKPTNKSYPIGNRARKRLKAFPSERNEVFYAFMVKNAFFGVFWVQNGLYLKKSAVQFFYFSYGKTLGRNLSSATKIGTPRCSASNCINYHRFRPFKDVLEGGYPYFVRNFYILIHFSSFSHSV